MNILFVGDIFASPGRRIVADHLQDIIETNRIDLAIANAENAAGGFGITPAIAEELFAMGLDVLTTGNHIWDKREIYDYLARQPRLLRPANYPEAPGSGVIVLAARNGDGLRRDQSARPHLHAVHRLPVSQSRPDSGRARPAVKVQFVDFHAEVTSEKIAMGWYLDGRVSAVVGTHTHVPTADTRILPGGTAYQTDCGMTGPYDSVIGVDTDIIIQRFLTGLPVRMEAARKGAELHAVIVDVDEATGQGARRAAPRHRRRLSGWTSPARFPISTAFYIQEIGALLFGLVFLFLYRQSRVVYFGLWSIAWLLRFLAAIFGYELLSTAQLGWLAPYAMFEFGFAIVLISAARAGFASGHEGLAHGAAPDRHPADLRGAGVRLRPVVRGLEAYHVRTRWCCSASTLYNFRDAAPERRAWARACSASRCWCWRRRSWSTPYAVLACTITATAPLGAIPALRNLLRFHAALRAGLRRHGDVEREPDRPHPRTGSGGGLSAPREHAAPRSGPSDRPVEPGRAVAPRRAGRRASKAWWRSATWTISRTSTTATATWWATKSCATSAHLLRISIRHEDEAFRWGGDEFVILFHNQQPEVAGKRMEEIEARLREFRVRGFGVLPISFSWGAADARGRALREALDEADRSMYALKRSRSAERHPDRVG